VGFSLSGNQNKKKPCIRERIRNFPALATISRVNGQDPAWTPGNCAEPEMFAHLGVVRRILRDLCETIRDTKDRGMHGDVEILTMSLTLKLDNDLESMSVKGKPFCEYCRRLANSYSSQILDICPV
jgi:hypothetical protein